MYTHILVNSIVVILLSMENSLAKYNYTWLRGTCLPSCRHNEPRLVYG